MGELKALEFAEGHSVGAGVLRAKGARGLRGDEKGGSGGFAISEDSEEGDGGGLPFWVWGGFVEGEVGDIVEAIGVHGFNIC